MVKKIFTAIGLSVITALGVPSSPVPYEYTQPDGTKVKIYQRGDEWLHWNETEDGYSVIFDRSSGFWKYVVFRNGELTATDYVVGSVDPESIGVPRKVGKFMKEKRLSILRKNPPLRYSASGTTGQRKTLVILVEFNNQTHAHNPNIPLDGFRDAFFSENLGSVKHYFSTVSQGAFTIVPAEENSGTSNDGIVGWLQLNQDHPACKDLSNLNCHVQLARDAILASDQYVDYSQFDSNGNGDGNITPDELGVIIVVAGYESATSGCDNNVSNNRVWAHQYGFPSNPPKVDGVNVRYYAMFGERQCIPQAGGGVKEYRATVGVMIHELGHLLLGLPDLYDTDYSSEGIGDLGLMGGGAWGRISLSDLPGSRPVYPVSWTLTKALGWRTAQTAQVSGLQQEFKVYEYAGSQGNVVKVTTKNASEYFLVSYRVPKSGTYDEGLKAFGISNGGIEILHIDESNWPKCKQENNCNKNEFKKLVDFEEADGSNALDSPGGRISDDHFFTTDSGRNLFNKDTNPSSRLNDGSDSGVSISVTGKGSDYYVVNTTGAVPESGGGDNNAQDTFSFGDFGGCSNLSPVSANLLLILPALLGMRRLLGSQKRSA